MVLPTQVKDVGPIMFTKFKNLVKNLFDSIIIIVYMDGDTEYHELHNSATNLGIQHLLSPPYTLEIVGSVERCHRHIVEIGLTLLYQPSFLASHFLSKCLPNRHLPYQSITHPTFEIPISI